MEIGLGNSLDHLIGSWSASEEEEFLAAVQVFERIDNEFWSSSPPMDDLGGIDLSGAGLKPGEGRV